MAFNPIQIVINAKDNASAVFSSLQAKVAAVGAAILSYFGIQAFAGATRGAADFESAMSRVQAATGASAQEMAMLRKTAQDVATSTQYTSVQAAGALENLAKAGLSAGDAVKTLPAVLNLASAGGIELGQASENLTKAIMGLGLSFNDAGRVADVLAKGANASNTSVEGLAQALSYAAPMAKTLGLSLEQTVAIIGKFADAGIDASRAGTALNSIMAQFNDPASNFRNQLALAGITTTKFWQALHQLAAAGDKGRAAIQAVGLEAGPALQALLGQGMGALDGLKKQLDNAAGSAAETARIMQDNLNGSLKGLAGVWETVKNVLMTPVLPVLKDGVDQLANALRNAVADGSLQRFGNSIAAAFQGGIKWVREFVGSIDFSAVGAKLQDFADRFATTMTQVGQSAATAGNTVQLVYGAMSAGVNGVLTAVYGIGSVFSEVLSTISTGIAKFYELSAKVTFGDMSKRFKQAAEDARSTAEGYSDAAQAMRDKAAESFQGMADSAQTARDGFTGLADAMRSSSDQTTTTSAALETVAQQLQKTAEANAEASAAQEKKTQADTQAKQAAADHAAALTKLRDQYDQLIASGNLQEAAQKLQAINKQLESTAATSAADKLKELEAAFSRLGVTSTQQLKNIAAAAQRDYETVRSSGIATAQDLQSSFKVAAEAAIAANNGIAPAWVQAEAAIRGYTIATDAAGKNTLQLSGSMNSATGIVAAHAAAVRDLAAAYDDVAAKAFAAQGQILAAAQAQKNADTANSSITKTQGKTNDISDLVPKFGSREEAEVWLQDFDAKYRRDNVGHGGEFANYMRSIVLGQYKSQLEALDLRDKMEAAKKEAEARKKAEEAAAAKEMQGGSSAPAPAPTPAPAPSSKGISAPVQPVTVHINLGGAIDLGTQTGIENLARKLTPAFNNLARRGAAVPRVQ